MTSIAGIAINKLKWITKQEKKNVEFTDDRETKQTT